MDECNMNLHYASRLERQQRICRVATNLSSEFNKFANESFDSSTTLDANSGQFECENDGENVMKQPKIAKTNLSESLHQKNISSDKFGNTSMDVDYSFTSENLDLSSRLSLNSSIINNVTSPQFSDRYIPVRSGSAWQTRFAMIPDSKSVASKSRKYREGHNANLGPDNVKDAHAYTSLLRNELLGKDVDFIKYSSYDDKKSLSSSQCNSIFQYSQSVEAKDVNIESIPPYSLSPVGPNSQKLLRSPRKATRKISRMPFKVLDAPELQDDFYLNLVDWSSQNVLSVGLGSCVYLWSACTSQVTRLCDLSSDANSVTSVSWNERGNLVAVGTHHGYVLVWDVAANKQVAKLTGHSARVGALAWSGDVLSSGSRDRLILQRDVR